MQIRSIFPQNEGKCCEQTVSAPFSSECISYIQSYRTREEMHYHRYPEFGICLQGSGIFFVEDRVYSFSAGSVTYFPAGMLHIAQSPREHHSEWLFLWQETDLPLPDREILTYDADCRTLTELLCRCAKRSFAGETDYYRALLRTLTERLLLCMDRITSLGEASARNRILPAIQLIARQYAEELPCSALAKACGVSEAVLRRLFQKATGTSPADYLISVRIRMAKNLLVNTGLSVLDIALECGFPVLSTFNRQFRKTTGMSPTEYRQTAVF